MAPIQSLFQISIKIKHLIRYLTDWAAVERNKKIEFNLESTPLQIYTDSEIGSGEKLWVQFSDSTGDVFGGISVDFTSQPTYSLGYCDSQVQISPTKLGPNINRVWTIVKWGTNVKLYCGGVQIFDIETQLSEKTSCRTRWALHSSKFQCAGTAADFYREHRSGKTESYFITTIFCYYSRWRVAC